MYFFSVCTKDIIPFNGIGEDREFLETLKELSQLDSVIPFDILIDQNKIFSHLNWLRIQSYILLTQTLMYSFVTTNAVITCISVMITWKTLLKRVTDLNLSSGCLSMIHTNIRSVAKNMNKFDSHLNNLKHEFPIIALSKRQTRFG